LKLAGFACRINAMEEHMTGLDRALDLARKDVRRSSDYYALFLNTELLIPTTGAPELDDQRADGGEAVFCPWLVEKEGTRYLMLFDSPEKLAAWAKKEIGFVRLPGHVIMQIMDPSIHWMLNVGTTYAREFVSDEIKWLQKNSHIRKA
jgi:hypothetical protein